MPARCLSCLFCAVIDIFGADHHTEKFLHLIGISINAEGATDTGNGIRTVFLNNFFEFGGYNIKCVFFQDALRNWQFFFRISGVLSYSSE